MYLSACVANVNMLCEENNTPCYTMNERLNEKDRQTENFTREKKN